MKEQALVWLGVYLMGCGALLTMYFILHSNFLSYLHKKFGDNKATNNRIARFLISERGGTEGDDKGGDGGIKFTEEQQKFVDKLIDRKYAEIKTKYGDYDDLKKFKDQHSKDLEIKQQKELEEQKKYDEAKKGYETKLIDLNGLVTKKDQEINDLRINHVLTNEITRQNGYAEETLALIKSQTSLDANGNVVMKIKDANGIDQTIPVADGVKKLLESRPYLVRSTHKQGSGTGSGTGTGGGTGSDGGTGGDLDLNALNQKYLKQFYAGDIKGAKETKAKINQKIAERQASAV